MSAEANNFNPYDMVDPMSSIKTSEETKRDDNTSDTEHYMEPSAFAFNPSRFDNMLEALPDELDLHDAGISGTGTVGSLDEHSLQLHGDPEPIPASRPIDIASCSLTGEIAPMWDFKVEDFMTTPAAVDFPSSRYLHHSESAPSGQRGYFNGGAGGGMSLGTGAFLNFNQSTSASPKSTDDSTPRRETMGPRRASNHFSRTVHTEDGGIALSSSATMNSVRKNPLARQVSSSSLSNYKRGSSSGISELPKKPPIQCYNCKTNKTPLWRRDPQGNTMCNACGLFQKLHGTMRPLSLKSDVIKKRNTKKRSEREKQLQESGAQSNNSSSRNPKQSARKNIKNSLYESSSNNNNNNNNDISINGFPLLPQSFSMPETNFDFGITANRMISQQSQSRNERQQHYTSASTESLNPNSLMDHNKNMANSNTQHSRKSRRSSTSSNNSNSSKSSSRSVVPILPKPSPGALQFNLSYNGTSNSAGNSTGSSPRVFPTGGNSDSPMNNLQQNVFSSSPGKIGISIPRRKSSRNHTSSSSFMAASLHQLQQHHQKQEQQQLGDGDFSGWNSGAVGNSTSPATRSPKGIFDLNASPMDSSINRNNPRKPHTSLLSQQLQNSAWHNGEASSHTHEQLESHTPSGSRSSGNSNTGTPQPPFLRSTSAVSSPRNCYEDSLLQRRGIKEEPGSNFRRQSPIWPRKNSCVKEQAIPSNNEAATMGNSVTLTASPTLSGIASPVAATASGESSSDGHKNMTEEFGWLKFNM